MARAIPRQGQEPLYDLRGYCGPVPMDLAFFLDFLVGTMISMFWSDLPLSEIFLVEKVNT
jgi:hypothetical protein